MRITQIALIVGLATGQAAAQDSASDRFASALDLWMLDDDAGSLPVFSELAYDGLRDAQLFLARLENSDLGPSAYRRNLSATEHRRLFRRFEASGGIGRTWMSFLARQGDPLAIALIDAGVAEPDPEKVISLVELGEREATHYAARLVALYGTASDRQSLLEADALPDGLLPYFAFLEGDPDPLAHGFSALRFIVGEVGDPIEFENLDAREMASFLGFGYQFGEGAHDNPFRLHVDAWLSNAPYVSPIQGFCDRSCPNSPSDCAFAILGLSDGYYGAIRLDTPIESVLSQSDFLQSLRAQNMAMRRAAFARTDLWEYVASIEQIAQVSSCLAQIVQAERASE